jgi:hypothetical protein
MGSLYNIDILKEFIDKTLYNLVEKISIDYNLNLNELTSKYNIISNNILISNEIIETKKEIKKEIKKENKKGRKKKIKDELIEMTEFMYENKKYLIDNNNNIYTYNIETPTQIGQKLVNGTIKFLSEYINTD